MPEPADEPEIMERPPAVPTPLAMPESALVPGPDPEQRDLPAVLARLMKSQADLFDQLMDVQAVQHERFLRLWRTAPDAAPAHGPPTGQAPALTTLTRDELERLADGPIGEVFGPDFADIDSYPRQIRPPRPPLLVMDRVTAIERAEGPGTGTIRTETDVQPDAWYLDGAGHMSVGYAVEHVQAGLVLLSGLGVDRLIRGERVCRLLDLEFAFHGSPPAAGETFETEFTIDEHVEHAGTRLVAFHGGGRTGHERRLSIHRGRMGFFTEEQLSMPSNRPVGAVWNPEARPPHQDVPLDAPEIVPPMSRFGARRLRALAAGRPADCFGPGWDRTRTHVRTPRIGTGRPALLDEVTELDPAGGPWKRGRLMAAAAVAPDDWYFAAHFPGDPVVPGSLLLDAAYQALSFYLIALGFARDKDGWRFEPQPERTCRMRGRGQVTPAAASVTYEVLVRELSAHPCPALVADVSVSVAGAIVFTFEELSVRLVPGWPLDHWARLGPSRQQRTGDALPAATLGGLIGHQDPGPVAVDGDGRPVGYERILAAAWGRPSQAFGWGGADPDRPQSVPRLPGPPFLFVSRIRAIGPGPSDPGFWFEAEYDVPEEAWYFSENAAPVMPFAVLLETALQSCGCLVLVRDSQRAGSGRLCRDLDGSITARGEVPRGTRTLRTRVEVTSSADFGDVKIVSFAFRVHAYPDAGGAAHQDEPVLEGTTTMGLFTAAELAMQQGLSTTEDDRARLATPPDGTTVDLRDRPARLCGGPLRLPGPMLLMIDRVTGN
ncbi:beta keto-acyl synthase, partial [Actinomadura sp. KC216]|uniref:hypothetical protein n=1 Tax=Actinomadura sp. KC216 TaxID=2530370 RepID=UPI0010D0F274